MEGDDVIVDAEELLARRGSPSGVIDGAFRESFEAFYLRELRPVIGLALVYLLQRGT